MKEKWWVWWYAPGVGTRKWAVARAGALLKEIVVDLVVTNGCRTQTVITPVGRGVIEIEAILVETESDGRREAHFFDKVEPAYPDKYKEFPPRDFENEPEPFI